MLYEDVTHAFFFAVWISFGCSDKINLVELWTTNRETSTITVNRKLALTSRRRQVPCWDGGQFTCKNCCPSTNLTNYECWDGHHFTPGRCCPSCWRGRVLSWSVHVQECQTSPPEFLDPDVFYIFHDRFKTGRGGAQQRLYLLSRLKQLVLDKDVPGSILELGCWDGLRTSVNIRLLLDAFDKSDREFHVFDSFEGLPMRTPEDGISHGREDNRGAMITTSDILIHNFMVSGVRVPDGIHQGFFGDYPDEHFKAPIAFAYFDSDMYQSILDSFRKVYHKMSPGGVIAIHDYMEAGRFPGVRRAVDEFLADKEEIVEECFGIVALIVKK